MPDSISIKNATEKIHTIEEKANNSLRVTGRYLFLGDLVALTLSFMFSTFIAWPEGQESFHAAVVEIMSSPVAYQLFMLLVFGVFTVGWFEQNGHYRQRLPYWETVKHILTLTVIGFVAGGFIQFAMKNPFSRMWLGFTWILFGFLLFMMRNVVRGILHAVGLWDIPAALIGDGIAADNAAHVLRQERKSMGYSVIKNEPPSVLAELKKPEDWLAFMRREQVSYIFIALKGPEFVEYQEAIQAAARASLPYAIIPPWLGIPSNGLRLHTFFSNDVLLMHNTNVLTLHIPRTIKRVFDVVVATLGFIALLPLFLVIALLVKTDGGPAFILNKRVGQNGRIFNCIKFRSMVQDNDDILEKYLADNPEEAQEWQEFQKLKNDPRVTRFGHFIRKTSIDELPQLINVIKGDMSLVGPRPILPGQEVFYGDDLLFYTAVRPGITGPWQVSGRNKLTFAQRVSLECWYARNWSLWMDIVILLKTVPTLLKKDQAF